MTAHIVGIVLAAGEGRRIGGPKALLRLGHETFLARVLAGLARPGVGAVCVVIGHEAARVRSAAGVGPDTCFLENERYSNGMLSSLLCGLAEARRRGADGVLVHPVDHPLVEPTTVDRVVDALAQGAKVAVPTYGGRRGHPAGFARSCWGALETAPADRGARSVLAEHPDWIAHVAGGPGCITGVNTPEDLAALRRLVETS